jgi:hypothetical protein
VTLIVSLASPPAGETPARGRSSDSACPSGGALVAVTWVAVSWVVLGAELLFAVWAWRYSSAPLAAALIVAAGLLYLDLPAVPPHALGFVAFFLVPVPFVEHVIALRRDVIASLADPLERWEKDRNDRPAAIDDHFDRHTLVMRSLGFRHAGDFVETSARDATTTRTYTRVFNGSDLRERALLQGSVASGTRRPRVTGTFLTFTSRCDDGESIVTTNARCLVPFPGVNDERIAAVPSRRGAAELLDVHRARMARERRSAVRQPTPHDWLEEQHTLRRNALHALVNRGYCARRGEGGFRLTWRGALRLSVADCPVLWPGISLAIRRREARLLGALRQPLPSGDAAGRGISGATEARVIPLEKRA